MRAYKDLEEIRDGVLASSRSKHKDRLFEAYLVG